MSEYHVTWSIDVEADDPHGAAEEAWRLVRKPDSTANVFFVHERTGRYSWLSAATQIDLSGDMEPEEIPARLLTPEELGTLLAVIVHGMPKLEDDASSMAYLRSATEKIKQMHGLPTGPAE